MRHLHVYPDTNIYFRPFDDCTNIRIELEANAVLLFWEYVRSGSVVCLSSQLIILEVGAASKEKRAKAMTFLQLATQHINFSPQVTRQAKRLVSELHIPPYDALHLAYAAEGKADILLTCDDDVLTKSIGIEDFFSRQDVSLRVQNPIEWQKYIFLSS
jgi:predicted nucleic acid-binding protein